MHDVELTPAASPVPAEVWSNPDYVKHQIERIQEGLTQVLFGDYSAVVQTDGGDPVWGGLAMHINVVINAARNAIARAEKSEALAAMRLTLEDKNRQLQAALAEVEEQNERIREAHRLLRQMFANVSHEFRTPLTLCMTPLQTLLNGEAGALGARQEYLLGVAQSSAAKVLGMINNLLELARLDADAVEIRHRRVELRVFFEQLIELFRPTAANRGIELRLVAPQMAERIVIDPASLEKIVANLLSNALKFTPAGGAVVVRARTSRRGLHILVKDTGIGIPRDALPTVFDRFRQVDGTLARRYEGTGIGLALVRELCERMGGDVRVWSRPGRGTAFRVFLPHGPADADSDEREARDVVQRRMELGVTAAPATPPPVAPASDYALGGPRVLVVEDNEEMATLVCNLLQPEFVPVWVRTGREALDVVFDVDPDAIVSDLMMPEIDGLTLCRRLKEQTELAPIPVILLTAQSDREVMVEGWEAGADDYLTKPFQAHELRVRVRSLVRLRASHRTLAARTAELEEANDKLVQSHAQLVQSSKMAAIGQLAAGVAHELNNPLTTILGFASSLVRRLGEGPQSLAADSIIREARRARNLVQDLLAFSRSSPARHERIAVAGVLERVHALCEHRARLQSVELVMRPDTGTLDVLGDPHRLEQVLVNLVNNALDAVGPGGRVVVDALREDGAVLLRVSDTGPGVPEEIRARIFEPFFTTKPAGKGTGLGLALCHDIIKAHGGAVRVTNPPEGGACFTVELPACETEVATCATSS